MLRKLMLGTALATFAAIGSANALLIDDFNNPVTPICGPGGCASAPGQVVNASNVSGPMSSTVSSGLPGTLGGSRQIDLGVTNPIASGLFFATAQVSINGAFSHNQNAGANAQSVLTWNGTGNGGYTADLTDGGLSDMFRIIVNSSDFALLWVLTVSDAVSGTSATADINAGPNGAPLAVYRAFDTFTGDLGVFDSATSIVLTGNYLGATTDADVAVDQIDTIPEPATMTVLGASLAGIALVARRRRKAA